MQIEAMKQQPPQLLVATPGRLLDLIDDDECPLTLGRSSVQAFNHCVCHAIGTELFTRLRV